MSTMGDILKALKDVVLMNERVERLSESTKELEQARRDMHDRLVRVEVFIELARGGGGGGGGHHRALPPTVQG